jgi:hypothetical protein
LDDPAPGGQSLGIMAIIDALFERDALAGLTPARRARTDWALKGT